MWNMNILDEETDLPNKAGETYQRLYNEEWRSSQLLEELSEENSFRGFMGQYKMKLLHGSEVLAEVDFSLENDIEIVCQGSYQSIDCVKNN